MSFLAAGIAWAGLCTILAFALAAQAAEGSEPHPPAALPQQPFSTLPVSGVDVDLKADQGPLDAWRHTIGHGGINSTPLPDRVVDGLARLRPRLIRIFIQQFFDVCPERDRYDWSRLDPYMDALARTGAKVVAAITIKPKPLYPDLDQAKWRPNDVPAWQRLIGAMARRYSVEKRIVSHWEIGNETDIGENGGCPYLIHDPKDYAEYYKTTIQPILAAFPEAKVGGCAVANAGADYLPKFIDLCRREPIRLDFVSWHLYSDDPGSHAGLVAKYRKLLDGFGEKRPEMMVTEWSKSFDPVSVEEMAFDPRRAAITAACLMAYIDAQADWTFYYHAWDQVCYLKEFQPFFQNPDIMLHHWNEVPHRFGLFGVNQEVRPQYFVYQMLGRMGERRGAAMSPDKALRVLAARDAGSASVMIVNGSIQPSHDRIAAVRFSGLAPGRKHLTVCRIDRGLAWSASQLELLAQERREVDVREQFSCQVFCPADGVCLLRLDEAR